MLARLGTGLVLLMLTGLSSAAAQEAKRPHRELGESSRVILAAPLREVESTLRQRLNGAPDNDELRFALGAARLLRSVERLGQTLYRYGYNADRNLQLLTFVGFPAPNLALPINSVPDRIDYEKLRGILSTLIDDLADVDEILAKVRDDSVKLPLPIGLIRLDLDGDGILREEESLWKLYAKLVNAPSSTEAAARDFVIVFDRADVEWLRGYTRLLRAMFEMVLAYDMTDFFQRVGHLFFSDFDSPFPFLKQAANARCDPYGYDGIVDLIALIHLTNFRIREPQRMKTAHTHLLAMIAHSRSMWRHVLAETDDDGEWIPSPRQTSVLANTRFTDEMVRGWLDALDEMEALLNGTKLVPFWRNDTRGVNLRKVFLEPADFDAVMWMQGTGVAKFLESGETTKPQTWARFQQLFQGRFFAFAAWVN